MFALGVHYSIVALKPDDGPSLLMKGGGEIDCTGIDLFVELKHVTPFKPCMSNKLKQNTRKAHCINVFTEIFFIGDIRVRSNEVFRSCWQAVYLLLQYQGNGGRGKAVL